MLIACTCLPLTTSIHYMNIVIQHAPPPPIFKCHASTDVTTEDQPHQLILYWHQWQKYRKGEFCLAYKVVAKSASNFSCPSVRPPHMHACMVFYSKIYYTDFTTGFLSDFRSITLHTVHYHISCCGVNF